MCGPAALSWTGRAGRRTWKAPEDWFSQTPNFSFARMYTVESEGGENFAGGEETRKKSQAGSPRQGARSFRTFIYKGAGWTSAGKQPQTITYKDKRGGRGAITGLAQKGNGPVHSHRRTHTCIHGCAHAHGCTATRALGHTVLSRIRTHTRTCVHTHSFSHTPSFQSREVGSNPGGSKPPKLQVSMKHFSRPHITSQSPRLCTPQPAPGVLQNLRSQRFLGKAHVAFRL